MINEMLNSVSKTEISSKWILYLFFSSLLFYSCKTTLKKDISFKNDKIEYMGRIGKTDSCKEIYWPGSSITFKFKGSTISAVLKDETGDNYFNIIIDGKVESILHPDTVKRIYDLTPNLNDDIHTVTLFKRTEWTNGKTLFYGVQLEENSKLLKISFPKKMIEFYGNSITAGYAVEDNSGNDSPKGTNTNNYSSYAAITARYFNADYSCIARSGIGITVSWFPMIMDEMYYRLDPTDENSKWDFSKKTPDIVVVNLLQNDSWIVNKPENDQFKNRFGKSAPTESYIVESYKNFIKKIRDKYSDAKIICMLGNMDITKKGSKWINIVKKAASELQDKNIYTLFVPFKNTKGHPNVAEQNALADSLIHFIKKKFAWDNK